MASPRGVKTRSFEEGAELGGVKTQSFDHWKAGPRTNETMVGEMTTRTGRAALRPEDGTDLLDGRPMQVVASDEFVVIQYNIHSLINFEERMEKLLFELSGRHWDVIVFLKRGERNGRNYGRQSGAICGVEVEESKVLEASVCYYTSGGRILPSSRWMNGFAYSTFACQTSS